MKQSPMYCEKNGRITSHVFYKTGAGILFFGILKGIVFPLSLTNEIAEDVFSHFAKQDLKKGKE